MTMSLTMVRSNPVTFPKRVAEVDLPEVLVLAFGAVRTQDRGVVPFKPFPWQREYLKAAKHHNRIVIDKSRDIGSSTIAVLQYTAEAVLFGGDFLIASYKRESSMGLFETAMTFLDNLQKYSRVLGFSGRYNIKTQTEVVLDNGSHIKAMEMSPRVGRSFRFRYLLGSEVAFWENAEKSFQALQGASVAGSKQTFESTPNPDDPKGALWEKLVDSPEYYKIVRDWRGNPNHTEEWAAQRLRILGARGFAQEHACYHSLSVSGTIVIPVSLYEQSVASPGSRDGVYHLGVDVARYGDDLSVIATRDGNVTTGVKRFSKVDTQTLAEAVEDTVRSLKTVEDVKVDVVGVGAGVVDSLNRKHLPCEVVAVAASERAQDPSKYVNVRAEMYFTLKEAMLQGAHLPDDQDLRNEILNTHYKFASDSRIRIESKEQIRKHLKRSPDELDAVALAYYDKKDDGVIGALL